MGGRGTRSGGPPAGGGGGFGVGVGGALGGVGPQAAPPTVQPGQPVPAITQAQLQAMDDDQFVAYLNGLKSTPIDSNTYYNSNWDTQRLVANMPELNMAPDVVDPQTFASLPGESLFRTVNAEGKDSAIDICSRTMASDVTTIGGGRMGDGFYFANDLSHSQTNYGKTRNNISKTATMEIKLNSNAKVVNEIQLKRMFDKESDSVKGAILTMDTGAGQWMYSGLTAYALKKGYNVVRSSSYVNIIDRRAATWSGNVIPWS